MFTPSSMSWLKVFLLTALLFLPACDLLSEKLLDPALTSICEEVPTDNTCDPKNRPFSVEWENQNPDLRSTHFINERIGWAVGWNGVILNTQDGGKNWVEQQKVKYTLYSIHFINEQVGWTVGWNGTILATKDGGDNWVEQKLKGKSTLFSIHFANEQKGWLVGKNGTIWTTQNGGETWGPQNSGVTSELRSIYFINEQKGWTVGGEGIILTTQNGGETWVRQEGRVTKALNSIHFVNEQTGWAVGNNGTILTTKNGGKTWNRLKLRSISTLFSIHFANEQRGWIVGPAGTIWATQNGGKTWKAQSSEVPWSLRSIHFINEQMGWAVGNRGTILATQNGGKSWEKQKGAINNNRLRSIHFINEQMGWAVGNRGTILATQNGGKSWEKRKGAINNNRLRSIHFINEQMGWITGWDGTILSTKNSGRDWEQQESKVSVPLLSIHFINEQMGWAVGVEGKILSTNNGGSLWETQTSPANSTLRSVHFINEQMGWVGGDDGTILTTKNGGKTWEKQSHNEKSTAFHSIYFISEQTGWVVGDKGTILTTKNGGNLWESQISGVSEFLHSIHFINEQVGWAAGDNRVILTTQNGGKDWNTSKRRKRGVSLDSIYLINQQTGWAVGQNGVMIKAVNPDFAPYVDRFGAEKNSNGVTLAMSIVDEAPDEVAVKVEYCLQSSCADPKEINTPVTRNKNGTVLLRWNPQDYAIKKGTELYYQIQLDDKQNKIDPQIITITKVSMSLKPLGPWHLIFLVLVFYLFLIIFRFIKSKLENPETWNDIVINDAPIEKMGKDLLGTRDLALGLSRFLQNKSTKAPVTLAITGGWGSGKSSVMGMMKDDLSRAGYNPVWFNAWHHYQEKHLFGALLETILQEGIPPFWRPSGMLFRLRLVLGRMWKRPLIPVITLVILFTVGLELFQGLDMKGKNIFEVLFSLENYVLNSSFFLALAGLVASMANRLSVFGLNPKQFFSQASQILRPINIDTDPGLRYRVNQALGDISKALGKKKELVIFIDDLDRCPAAHVIKVLECVNFLSAPPRQSFIILGMALGKVLPSISGEFTQIVEENLKEIEGEDSDTRRLRLKQERLALAKHYLEKMVNVEVHIPEPDSNKLGNLADPNEKPEKLGKGFEDYINFVNLMLDKWYFPFIFWSLLCLGLFIGGQSLSNQYKVYQAEIEAQALQDKLKDAEQKLQEILKAREKEAKKSIKPRTKESPEVIDQLADQIDQEILQAQKKALVQLDQSKSKVKKAQQKVKERRKFQDDKGIELKNKSKSIAPWVGGIMALFIFIMYYLSRKAEIKDAPAFTKALQAWANVINAHDNTPRHFKLTVNQLRLAGMRTQLIKPSKGSKKPAPNKQIVSFVILQALNKIGVDSIKLGDLKDNNKLELNNISDEDTDENNKNIEKLSTKLMTSLEIPNTEQNEIVYSILVKALATHSRDSELKELWPQPRDTEAFKNLMQGITLN
jgi:photosystem II stability/assembly factor-like uncharacterized protein